MSWDSSNIFILLWRLANIFGPRIYSGAWMLEKSDLMKSKGKGKIAVGQINRVRQYS